MVFKIALSTLRVKVVVLGIFMLLAKISKEHKQIGYDSIQLA